VDDGRETGSGAPFLHGEDDVIECLETGELRHAVALCARYHALYIGRLCMAMLADQAEAEDLVQETLLAAYAGFATWRREGSVRAWLLGVARKKALKQLEQRRRHTAKLHLVKGGEAAQHRESGAEELLVLKQKADLARTALGRIRPTEREALLLRYVGELCFGDVAEACGATEATARKRVSRGLAHLRDAVGDLEKV